ncbi:MAG TPA: DoxX family protein [Candidatus Angelobacter sp.]|nr:DoxX family protein [Candidatus Angelobacter sp.]
MKIPFLLGRIVFGGFFVFNGIHHFMERKTMAEYAKAKNVPASGVAVPATGAALLIGGTSILLGVKPKLGALAIIGFLAGVSPMMHNFWSVEDPNQRMNEMINFSKNVALLGAALALLAVEEPWPASVPVAQPKQPRYVTRDIVAA